MTSARSSTRAWRGREQGRGCVTKRIKARTRTRPKARTSSTSREKKKPIAVAMVVATPTIQPTPNNRNPNQWHREMPVVPPATALRRRSKNPDPNQWCRKHRAMGRPRLPTPKDRCWNRFPPQIPGFLLLREVPTTTPAPITRGLYPVSCARSAEKQ